MSHITATVPGPWAIDNTRPKTWGIVHTGTGRFKAVGPAGRMGRGRNIVNYFDRALELANQRNRAEAQKTPT